MVGLPGPAEAALVSNVCLGVGYGLVGTQARPRRTPHHDQEPGRVGEPRRVEPALDRIVPAAPRRLDYVAESGAMKREQELAVVINCGTKLHTHTNIIMGRSRSSGVSVSRMRRRSRKAIGAGTLVATYAVIGQLGTDGAVELVQIDLDTDGIG
jgi:hypothetical protein